LQFFTSSIFHCYYFIFSIRAIYFGISTINPLWKRFLCTKNFESKPNITERVMIERSELSLWCSEKIYGFRKGWKEAKNFRKFYKFLASIARSESREISYEDETLMRPWHNDSAVSGVETGRMIWVLPLAVECARIDS